MGQIDDVCRKVVESTEGAAACALVDLESGMLLGVHDSAASSLAWNDSVAAATLEMFRGALLSRGGQPVRQPLRAPASDEHHVEEVLLTSRNRHHFMRSVLGGRAVLMLVTRRSADAGMGWAQLRAALARVEPLVP